MSKKILPKAIRTGATRRSGPESHPRVSEPLPEMTQSAKARQGSSAGIGSIIEAGDTSDERKVQARKLVERFSLWAGVAGMLPAPVIDLAAVGGVQIQMLRRISQIYDVPFSKNRGKAILASLAGTMIPVSAGLGMASTIKSVPLAGSAIGAITTPALAMAATYVIGMAFVEHFSRGGTLLDFEPPDYQEFIKAEMNLRKT
ncbi:MAG TPA: YcjF family protein [Pseudolabrys sp.]|nr:YcjF family protein [Pseudolabrys sp.]